MNNDEKEHRDELHKAITLADAIRRDHNGIMQVEIHLGHDGDNTVRLKDYDKTLAEHSCDNLLRSVEEVVCKWREEKR